MSNPGTIFISYRRDDSIDICGRIYDRLALQFGQKAIFKDVDNIPLGVNFRKYIDQEVGRCQVLLVVIGSRWLSATDAKGKRRLENPQDFVRLEIESALNRDIPVIPLLVSDAEVPAPTELPPSLQELAYRNGTQVRSDPDFHRDMDRLIRGLEELTQGKANSPRGSDPGTPSTQTQPQQFEPTSPPSAPTFQFEVITVNAQGQEINRSSQTAEYFAEDLGDSVSLEMVAIPGGSYLMGSPDTEVERFDAEGPQHTVTIAPFFIGKYPVTQAQWRAVASFPQIDKPLELDPSRFKGTKRPVEQVSWLDAMEFCARLSKKTGQDYRLPSEAEWEYACRAGTTTPFLLW